MGMAAVGVMMVLIFSGCGSSGDSGKSVQAKKEKAAAGAPAKQKGMVVRLLTEKEEGAAATSKRDPQERFEVLPGLTREEAEAKMAADRAAHDRGPVELLPGVLLKDVEAKIKANQGPKDHKGFEALPGVPREVVEAKMAADRAQEDPKTREVLPGVSRAELAAKTSRQQAPERRELVPPPGVK